MENNSNKLIKADSSKLSAKNNSNTVVSKAVKKKDNFKSNRFRSNRFVKAKKRNFFKAGLVGRPYSFYRTLTSKYYLYFTLSVRPNNVFATLKGVCQEKKAVIEENKEVLNLTASENILPKTNSEINIRKKSSDFDIKCSKKGVKTKVLTFLNRFIFNITPKKVFKYSFLIVNIIAPKMIRKKILNTIYSSYAFKKFKGKRLILNINHNKIFNGCTPRKKIKKKRRKFRLFK